MDIEIIANSLMRKDFINMIQPYIKRKCSLINLCVSPQKWILDKENNRIIPSDCKYPPEIQEGLDIMDKMIEQVKESLSTEQNKRRYLIQARRLTTKE